jgi:hypothetical protein
MAMGFQQAASGFSEYLNAFTTLLLGNPQLARKRFEDAFGQAGNAIEVLSGIGQWGKYWIPFVEDLRNRSKALSISIFLATKHAKRRIAIDASKQFLLLFFVLLFTFIALDYSALLQTAALDKMYVSLVVASISAFGLNAGKLKELFFPSKP